MPIFAIKDQPGTSALKAAYRPVLFLISGVRTDGYITPPVMYCDIYFNGIFYKTISKTQWKRLNDVGLSSNTSDWEFDIQDAAQEYFKKYIAANGLAQIVQVDLLMIKSFCRFRSSGFNTEGYIKTENIAPVQGTGSSVPVAGTGTQSNTFFILNAALQHEDNQDLATHLDAYKRRSWASDTNPLSHRPDIYRQTTKDSDFFPISYTGADVPSSLVLNYRFRGQSTWRNLTNLNVIPCPNVSNLQAAMVNNGDTTQTITFTFDALPSLITGLAIGYRTQGTTGAFTAISGTSTSSPRVVTLPLGVYEFQFTTTGGCIDNPILLPGIGVPSTPCTGVTIPGSPTLPDGHIGLDYSAVIDLAGTAPFTLSNITKPLWMTIVITGSQVVISGTPSATGTGLTVAFRVSNCYSGNQVDFTDTIDIGNPANGIYVQILPGNMDVGFAPSSCWLWTGTVSIKDGGGSVLATQTWSSHTDPSLQQESIGVNGLADGTYNVEWDLQSVQNCDNVLTLVDYIENFGSPTTVAASGTHSVAVSGNITKQIQLLVNNA